MEDSSESLSSSTPPIVVSPPPFQEEPASPRKVDSPESQNCSTPPIVASPPPFEEASAPPRIRNLPGRHLNTSIPTSPILSSSPVYERHVPTRECRPSRSRVCILTDIHKFLHFLQPRR